jgi:hypothetical protein
LVKPDCLPAVIDGIKENIEENISPFSNEIISASGTVKVHIASEF